MQHGVVVDYHSVIDGPVTQAGLSIESGPRQLGRGGPWVVWLKGKSGCVAIEAITRAAASASSDTKAGEAK